MMLISLLMNYKQIKFNIMIKKQTLFLIFSFIAFISCNKDDQLYCEENNIGYLTITNTSDNNYEIYLNDIFEFEIEANSYYEEWELAPGNYSLSAIEITGNSPVAVDKTISIEECGHECWVLD